ncbi:hypothetical protein ABZ912_13140 [Nonomuraea angiospora]|uniref:scabin-related ADP-ribosyltransferase n=1 Tax=Nonomuraea angiospora TaxID=46172 RepID=UPI0033EF8C7E
MGLAGAGMRLARFGDDSTRTAGEADDLTSWVHSRNDSEGVRAFHDDWRDETGLAAEGESISGTTVLIGFALLTAAVIVIVYKLTVLYALMRLVMRLSAMMFLPGAGAAAYEAEKIAATRLRGTFGEMFARMVLRPLVKASERLGAPMARKPRQWPASFHDDRLHAAARRVDLGKLGVSNPAWRTDRRLLWRGDDRHPDEIFEKGFHPKGDRVTLAMHQDQPYDSAFVSTTRSPNLDLLRQHDYRYVIDAPGGLNLNRTLRRNKLRNGTSRCSATTATMATGPRTRTRPEITFRRRSRKAYESGAASAAASWSPCFPQGPTSRSTPPRSASTFRARISTGSVPDHGPARGHSIRSTASDDCSDTCSAPLWLPDMVMTCSDTAPYPSATPYPFANSRSTRSW